MLRERLIGPLVDVAKLRICFHPKADLCYVDQAGNVMASYSGREEVQDLQPIGGRDCCGGFHGGEGGG